MPESCFLREGSLRIKKEIILDCHMSQSKERVVIVRTLAIAEDRNTFCSFSLSKNGDVFLTSLRVKRSNSFCVQACARTRKRLTAFFLFISSVCLHPTAFLFRETLASCSTRAVGSSKFKISQNVPLRPEKVRGKVFPESSEKPQNSYRTVYQSPQACDPMVTINPES